ncbi:MULTISPECIES: hypothetical protein [Thalassospira]|jgi:hypothetical protein|uniref:hypothetical protein n=1 Tax=Thalassospira TaxID=168934 RepID=UPI0008DCAC62|nr:MULTISPECIES: hypothetical protein [Thalassospira]MDM7975251.1 hypothetical protein [Thalassospira xiamenensis]OHZ00968.1 hypothetical protein BC440_09000 [Thalassospira sp. MIT1004]QPL37497.1 hypothetical protein IT971_09490 [Thalassospira sp. B30-1]
MTCYPHIENGEVRGVYYSPQPGKAEEPYTDDDPLIVAYFNPPTAIQDIKDEARRRIDEIVPRWMIDREILGGDPVPQELKEQAESIRTASDGLEVILPYDYTADSYWPSTS